MPRSKHKTKRRRSRKSATPTVVRDDNDNDAAPETGPSGAMFGTEEAGYDEVELMDALEDDAVDSTTASPQPPEPTAEDLYAGRDPFESVTTTGVRDALRVETSQPHRRVANVDMPPPQPLYNLGELARAQLAQLRPHLAGDALTQPLNEADVFVVRGMSQTEPNPQYAAVQAQRQSIVAQLASVQHSLAQWDAFTQYALFPRGEAQMKIGRNDRAYRLQLMQSMCFEDGVSYTMLKPAAEALRLNELWRTLLHDELLTLRAAYAATTNASVIVRRRAQFAAGDPAAPSEAQMAADASAVTQQFMSAVVDPVVNVHYDTIMTTNFEDRPLLLLTLGDYFSRYLVMALHHLLDGGGGGDDDRMLLTYFADTIERYAYPDYARWFEVWAEKMRQRRGRNQPLVEAGIGQLKRYVKRIVRERIALARLSAAKRIGVLHANRRRRRARNPASVPRFFRVYTPMDERDAREGYRLLVTNQIALRRARFVGVPAGRRVGDSGVTFTNALDAATHDFSPLGTFGGAETLRTAIKQYLDADVDVRFEPSQLLAHPTNDWFRLLDEISALMQVEIETQIVASPAETDDERASIDARRLALLQLLARQTGRLTETFVAYAGQRDRVIVEHAPSDVSAGGRDAEWSPFDLSYPLDRDRSTLAIPQLVALVNSGLDSYDANADHERANTLRCALDSHHARRMLERQKAELEHTLDNVLASERRVPRTIVRDFESFKPAAFRVEMALSPLLEARIMATRGDDAALSNEERNAQEWLDSSRFEVRWFHAPQFADTFGDERELRRRVIAGGAFGDTLSLIGPPEMHGDDPHSTLQLLHSMLEQAGVYRAELRRVLRGADEPAANAVVYRSEFRGALRIVAQCARDGVKFQPTPAGTAAVPHTCRWTEQLQTDVQLRMLARISTLVYSGPTAHQALVLKQAERSSPAHERLEALAARIGALLPPLPLPPWGASTPVALERIQYESDAMLLARFSLGAVMRSFVARVAATVRLVVIAEQVGITRAEEATLGINPAVPNFSAVISGVDVLRSGDTAVFVAVCNWQANALGKFLRTTPEQLENVTAAFFDRFFAVRLPVIGATSLIAVPSVRGVAQPPVLSEVAPGTPMMHGLNAMEGVIKLFAGGSNAQPRQPAQGYLQGAEWMRRVPLRKLLDVSRNDSESAPGRGQVVATGDAQVLFRSLTNDVATMPLATLLLCLSTPLMQAMASVRERAFFAVLAQRFNVFAHRYRAVQRRERYHTRRELDGPRPPFGGPRGGSFVDWSRADPRADAAIDDELAAMTQFSIRQHIATPAFNSHDDLRANMFTDTQSLSDYRTLLRKMLKPVMRTARAPQHERRASLACNMWIGTHTVLTNQPSPLNVHFVAPGAGALPRELYGRAKIGHFGSCAPARNYDCDGLRNAVNLAIKRYNARAHELSGGRFAVAFMTEQLDAASTAVWRAQLIYNFFALVAPPADTFLTAEQLYHRIESGKYNRLMFRLPLNEATVV